MFDFTSRGRGSAGLAGSLAAVLVLAGGVAGCSGKYPNAVAFNRELPEEADDGIPGRADQQLTARQQADSVAAMKQVAQGHRVTERPAAAPRGVRWTEIPRAVAWASGQAGVEVAITATYEEPLAYRFELLTIEGWPGELVIVRGADGEVYEVESAWVGRFPDAPEHQERAGLLVREFEARLRVLGARRKFNQ